MYKKKVKPAVVDGRETWVVTEMDMERMGYVGGEHIERGTWSGGGARIWIARTDEELREVCKDVGL